MPSPDKFIEQIWYSPHPLGWLLIPLGWIYAIVITVRRWCYQTGIIAMNQVDAPVIVVGNMTVAGTGKTPLVLWLVEYFRSKGLKPGVISRGYGGNSSSKLQQVRADSDPTLVGDEPVLLARNTLSPVAIARKRRDAAEELITRYNCDLIISDDGLQHYALDRDIEIAMIDGLRRFGNGRCLPAGPLRELPGRIQQVDIVVSKFKSLQHEYQMDYTYGDLVALHDHQQQLPINELSGQSVRALAGIGNPERFFFYLRQQKLRLEEHEFPDHYDFQLRDLQFNDGLPVIMTEKDAVKCCRYVVEQGWSNYWYLPIKASLPEAFIIRLENLMRGIVNEQETA